MSAPLPRQIGRYEIEERLGQGGMGQVYLGRDPQTGERAAIKVLSAALAQEEGFLERFQREIEALRKFSHPHIVRLYEDGVEQGAPWFAMEYVPGGTLLDLLRSERRLDWRRAYKLAIETCSALKAAHDQGVVHRDLKPSNLLIDPDEHVHLTDFGVAQSYAASQRLTFAGGVIGTAEYMSPEQAAGQRATRHSDLYSLGAVMY
ncbi:MAG: serine/threonine-protein kinase, partial [Planctomycetaceae bacterium]